MKKNFVIFLILFFLSITYNVLTAQENMILTFNTELGNGTTVTLPLQGNVNVMVDWGDGTTPQSITTSGNLNYTYAAGGVYTVSISGNLTHFGSWSSYTNAEKIISCTSFGDLGITSLRGAFIGAVNLTEVPDAIPSTVTDLSRMFSGAESFNQSLGSWDLSSVNDMEFMFYGATSFNQDLSAWDVSSVTNMGLMFSGATLFNQNLSAWDVSSVTYMSAMFLNATSFNQDLSNWDVSGIVHMAAMFGNAISFNQDLSSWDVSSVTDMGLMFNGATSFNQDLSSWDVSSVTNMRAMFFNAISFNQNLSTWDVSSVTNMLSMFNGAISFNQDLSSWDVSSVTNMQFLFQNAMSFNQDLSSWNVSNVTNMRGMFNGAITFNQDLSSWNVGSVMDMWLMFQNAASFNHDLSSWDVSSVINMQDMFKGVKLSTVNYNNLLMSWSQLTLRSNVFFDAGASNYSEGASSEARQSILDNYGWTITDGGMVGSTLYEISASIDPVGAGSVNGMEFFSQQYGEGEIATLIAYPNYNHKFISWTENGTLFSTENPIEFETTQNRILVANFEEDNTSEPMSLTFNTELSSGTGVSLPLLGYVNVLVNWGDGTTEIIETNGLKNHTYAEEGTYTLTINGTLTQFGYGTGYPNAEKLISVSSFGDLGLTSLRGAFRGAVNLLEVPEAIPSTVTDLGIIFYNATSFNQDLSYWDVSSVSDMGWMFGGATSYNQNLGSWDMSSTTNMGSMFRGATSFNQDLSTWDVSNVTNMQSVFSDATSFNQDLSTWDVSSVKDMGSMFNGATSFNQDLSTWDVSNVTSMYRMFRDATSFNQNLSTWDVSSITDMRAMFGDAASFDQDLSSWDVSSVKSMDNMFYGVKLSTVNYNSLLTSWSQQTLQSYVRFSAGISTYSVGAPAEARQSIIDDYGWTITDGGIGGTLYEITASISPANAGTVNGSEYFSQQYEEGETATLIAIPHAGYNFVNWTEDGVEVSTGIVLSFTVSQARNLVANFDHGTAISEVNSNTKFIVYPNPANELIHITFDKYDLNSDNVEIVLYDLSGKTYRIDNFSVYQNKMSLNVSDRTPGIYFIQMIVNGEKVETAKVKIMR